MTDETSFSRSRKRVTITDVGTVVEFQLEGRDIWVTDTGGTNVLELLRGSIDSEMQSEAIADKVLELWLDGYDGDSNANRLRVEVEQEVNA